MRIVAIINSRGYRDDTSAVLTKTFPRVTLSPAPVCLPTVLDMSEVLHLYLTFAGGVGDLRGVWGGVEHYLNVVVGIPGENEDGFTIAVKVVCVDDGNAESRGEDGDLKRGYGVIGDNSVPYSQDGIVAIARKSEDSESTYAETAAQGDKRRSLFTSRGSIRQYPQSNPVSGPMSSSPEPISPTTIAPSPIRSVPPPQRSFKLVEPSVVNYSPILEDEMALNIGDMVEVW